MHPPSNFHPYVRIWVLPQRSKRSGALPRFSPSRVAQASKPAVSRTSKSAAHPFTNAKTGIGEGPVELQAGLNRGEIRLRAAGPVAPPAAGGRGRTASRRGPVPRPGPPVRRAGHLHPMSPAHSIALECQGPVPIAARVDCGRGQSPLSIVTRLNLGQGRSPVLIVAWGSAPGQHPPNQPRAESPPHYLQEEYRMFLTKLPCALR